jgi:nitrogen regulatory protein PII
MKPVKRIEIIIDSLDIRMVLQELEDIGISSYSVVRDVIGLGDRGARRGRLIRVWKRAPEPGPSIRCQ